MGFLSSCLKRRFSLHEFALSSVALQWSGTVAVCSWFSPLSCPVTSHGKPANNQPNSTLPRIAIFGGRGLPKRTKPNNQSFDVQLMSAFLHCIVRDSSLIFERGLGQRTLQIPNHPWTCDSRDRVPHVIAPWCDFSLVYIYIYSFIYICILNVYKIVLIGRCLYI